MNLKKTITLDDEAYGRLRAWKRSERESFSSVVKRVLPAPGTLAALLAFAESQGTASFEGNEKMESSIEASRSPAKHDPWT